MYLEQIRERETLGCHIVFLKIFDAKVKTLKKLAFINKVNLEKIEELPNHLKLDRQK